MSDSATWSGDGRAPRALVERNRAELRALAHRFPPAPFSAEQAAENAERGGYYCANYNLADFSAEGTHVRTLVYRGGVLVHATPWRNLAGRRTGAVVAELRAQRSSAADVEIVDGVAW